MSYNYDHLRTPSAYDDMIRPLLAAKEAVEANMAAVIWTTEYRWLAAVGRDINDAIASLTNAHRWDGDEPRT